MKINKIRKKLIKPHTPTPQNLKNYKLSLIDNIMWQMNFGVVLFFESKPEELSQLEDSLAKILVEFYPLAGRYIKNDHMVDCSDHGVEFVEAEALDVELMDLVLTKNMEVDQRNDLLPDQFFRVDAETLMSIQATHFPCGGLAIAISVSHRVFDVSSLGTFISAWSNAANPDNNKAVGFKFKITPSFDLPSLLPHKDHDLSVAGSDQQFSVEAEKLLVKRLLFDKEALTRLKSNISSNNNGSTISRVRVVSAVIAKALIGVDRTKHDRNRDFFISQVINMRERTISPQPKHACGNFAIPSLTRRVAASEAKDFGIEELVDLIGDSVGQSIADYAEILSPNRDERDIIINTFGNFIKQVWNPEVNAIMFTDWSKFGFYEADFGWGKPVWTSIEAEPRCSGTVLMSNNEGDGIEAWVHLNQNDMRYLEQDEEIKLFTT